MPNFSAVGQCADAASIADFNVSSKPRSKLKRRLDTDNFCIEDWINSAFCWTIEHCNFLERGATDTNLWVVVKARTVSSGRLLIAVIRLTSLRISFHWVEATSLVLVLVRGKLALMPCDFVVNIVGPAAGPLPIMTLTLRRSTDYMALSTEWHFTGSGEWLSCRGGHHNTDEW